MESLALKNKVHSLIETCNEEVLQAVYQILEEPDYTEDFKNILNEELGSYQKNKTIITQEAMDKQIAALMKTK